MKSVEHEIPAIQEEMGKLDGVALAKQFMSGEVDTRTVQTRLAEVRYELDRSERNFYERAVSDHLFATLFIHKVHMSR